MHLFSRDREYYTGLTEVNGKFVFKELNNELLGTWNKWGTVTGDTCTVYANEGGEWFWHTNNCDQPCLYICEYIIPTPGRDKFCIFLPTDPCLVWLHYTNLLSGSHSIMFEDTLYDLRNIWLNSTYFCRVVYHSLYRCIITMVFGHTPDNNVWLHKKNYSKNMYWK